MLSIKITKITLILTGENIESKSFSSYDTPPTSQCLIDLNENLIISFFILETWYVLVCKIYAKLN